MKNKKLTFIYIGIIIILAFLTFGKNFIIQNTFYHEQKDEILDYIKEQYNIKPKITSIIKMVGMKDHKYVYYVCMNYDNNDFTAYIYDNGTIIDDYISLKLGREIYDEVVSNVESELNTEVLNLHYDWNRIYLNYLEETSLPLDMTVNKLLSQTDKETKLSLILVIKDNKLIDSELANKLYNFINNYIKEKGVDYLTVDFTLIDSKSVKTVEKNQSVPEHAKRYISFSDLNVSNFSVEELKDSVETVNNSNLIN